MKYLFDTNILIDVLREKTEAVSFTRPLRSQAAISTLTYTELLSGVRSEKEFESTKQFAESFKILEYALPEAVLAGDFMRRFSKSHALDLADAAIAATAKHHNLELKTLNVKHFPMFPGLKKPY